MFKVNREIFRLFAMVLVLCFVGTGAAPTEDDLHRTSPSGTSQRIDLNSDTDSDMQLLLGRENSSSSSREEEFFATNSSRNQEYFFKNSFGTPITGGTLLFSCMPGILYGCIAFGFVSLFPLSIPVVAATTIAGFVSGAGLFIYEV